MYRILVSRSGGYFENEKSFFVHEAYQAYCLVFSAMMIFIKRESIESSFKDLVSKIDIARLKYSFDYCNEGDCDDLVSQFNDLVFDLYDGKSGKISFEVSEIETFIGNDASYLLDG